MDLRSRRVGAIDAIRQPVLPPGTITDDLNRASPLQPVGARRQREEPSAVCAPATELHDDATDAAAASRPANVPEPQPPLRREPSWLQPARTSSFRMGPKLPPLDGGASHTVGAARSSLLSERDDSMFALTAQQQQSKNRDSVVDADRATTGGAGGSAAEMAADGVPLLHRERSDPIPPPSPAPFGFDGAADGSLDTTTTPSPLRSVVFDDTVSVVYHYGDGGGRGELNLRNDRPAAKAAVKAIPQHNGVASTCEMGNRGGAMATGSVSACDSGAATAVSSIVDGSEVRGDDDRQDEDDDRKSREDELTLLDGQGAASPKGYRSGLGTASPAESITPYERHGACPYCHALGAVQSEFATGVSPRMAASASTSLWPRYGAGASAAASVSHDVPRKAIMAPPVPVAGGGSGSSSAESIAAMRRPAMSMRPQLDSTAVGHASPPPPQGHYSAAPSAAGSDVLSEICSGCGELVAARAMYATTRGILWLHRCQACRRVFCPVCIASARPESTGADSRGLPAEQPTKSAASSITPTCCHTGAWALVVLGVAAVAAVVFVMVATATATGSMNVVDATASSRGSVVWYATTDTTTSFTDCRGPTTYEDGYNGIDSYSAAFVPYRTLPLFIERFLNRFAPALDVIARVPLEALADAVSRCRDCGSNHNQTMLVPTIDPSWLAGGYRVVSILDGATAASNATVMSLTRSALGSSAAAYVTVNATAKLALRGLSTADFLSRYSPPATWMASRDSRANATYDFFAKLSLATRTSAQSSAAAGGSSGNSGATTTVGAVPAAWSVSKDASTGSVTVSMPTDAAAMQQLLASWPLSEPYADVGMNTFVSLRQYAPPTVTGAETIPTPLSSSYAASTTTFVIGPTSTILIQTMQLLLRDNQCYYFSDRSGAANGSSSDSDAAAASFVIFGTPCRPYASETAVSTPYALLAMSAVKGVVMVLVVQRGVASLLRTVKKRLRRRCRWMPTVVQRWINRVDATAYVQCITAVFRTEGDKSSAAVAEAHPADVSITRDGVAAVIACHGGTDPVTDSNGAVMRNNDSNNVVEPSHVVVHDAAARRPPRQWIEYNSDFISEDPNGTGALRFMGHDDDAEPPTASSRLAAQLAHEAWTATPIADAPSVATGGTIVNVPFVKRPRVDTNHVSGGSNNNNNSPSPTLRRQRSDNNGHTGAGTTPPPPPMVPIVGVAPNPDTAVADEPPSDEALLSPTEVALRFTLRLTDPRECSVFALQRLKLMSRAAAAPAVAPNGNDAESAADDEPKRVVSECGDALHLSAEFIDAVLGSLWASQFTAPLHLPSNVHDALRASCAAAPDYPRAIQDVLIEAGVAYVAVAELQRLITEDLWRMSNVNYDPDVPLDRVYSKTMVLLYAYLYLSLDVATMAAVGLKYATHKAAHQRRHPRRQNSSRTDGHDDGAVNEPDDFDDPSAKRVLAALRAHYRLRGSAMLDHDNGRIAGLGPATGADDDDDDGWTLQDMIRHFHAMQRAMPQARGVLSTKVQVAHHIVTASLPGDALLWCALLSALVVLASTAVAAHETKLRNNQSVLLNWMFRWSGAGSLPTMLAYATQILMLPRYYGIPSASYHRSRLHAAYLSVAAACVAWALPLTLIGYPFVALPVAMLSCCGLAGLWCLRSGLGRLFASTPTRLRAGRVDHATKHGSLTPRHRSEKRVFDRMFTLSTFGKPNARILESLLFVVLLNVGWSFVVGIAVQLPGAVGYRMFLDEYAESYPRAAAPDDRLWDWTFYAWGAAAEEYDGRRLECNAFTAGRSATALMKLLSFVALP